MEKHFAEGQLVGFRSSEGRKFRGPAARKEPRPIDREAVALGDEEERGTRELGR